MARILFSDEQSFTSSHGAKRSHRGIRFPGYTKSWGVLALDAQWKTHTADRISSG
jgi:hypothetical protein